MKREKRKGERGRERQKIMRSYENSKREKERQTHTERERGRKINQITSFLKLFCWISIKECTFKCCEIFLKVKKKNNTTIEKQIKKRDIDNDR